MIRCRQIHKSSASTSRPRPQDRNGTKSLSTIERRLSSLTWNYTQRGQPLDRKDRHIATVLAGIRNKHASPPRQKEAILRDDLVAMLETLDRGTLRGLRGRAMLLLASPAACAAPKSWASMLRAIKLRMAAAGLNFSWTRACWLRCEARPAGARSRLAAARPMPPARSSPYRPG